MSKTKGSYSVPVKGSEQDIKPIITIMMGFALIICWYLVTLIVESLIQVIYPVMEEFYETFAYIVIDWQLEALFTVLLVHFLLKNKTGEGLESIGWKHRKGVRIIILSFLFGFIAFYMQELIYRISIIYLPENYPAQELQEMLELYNQNSYRIVFFILIVFVTPVVEEIFMRGFCYKFLRIKYNVAISVFACFVVFWIFHPVVAWFPHLFFANLLLCLLYEQTKYIGASISLHSSINFFVLTDGWP